MTSRQTAANRGRSGRVLPVVELLEDRTCLSTLSLHGHILTLTGDNTSNTITIHDAGNGNVSASIKTGGATRTFNAHDVQGIVVDSGGGNDSVIYDLTGKMTTSRSIMINLGAGQDQASLDFSQGVSAANLTVQVTGGKGADHLKAVFGAIHNTHVDFRSMLGVGNDQFNASFNGAITGTAKVDVLGQDGPGFDGLDIGFRSDIGAAAQVAVNVLDGVNSSTAHVDYQGRLDGRLSIHEQAGPGGDLLASDVTLDAGSKGSLSDTLHGARGDDLFVLRLHDHSGKMKSVVASITGGGGDDIAVRAGNVKVTGAKITH
jgi:hypothetical protein